MAIVKGVVNNSRRVSDYIKWMESRDRELHIKQFIASCEAKLLLPYIKITKHDKHYREIEYEVVIPEGERREVEDD